MKLIPIAVILLTMGFGAKAGPTDQPLTEFLGSYEYLVGKLSEAEAILKKEIATLDAIATTSRTLSSEQAVDFVRNVADAYKVLFSVGSTLDSMAEKISRAAPISSEAHNRVRAVAALFDHAVVMGARAPALTTRYIEELLGSLRQAYFIVVNTSGNLMLVLNDAATLQTPSLSQLTAVRAAYSGLLQIFRRGAKAIDEVHDYALGDRTVFYVFGFKSAYYTGEGPLPPLAKRATEIERRISQELSVAVGKMQHAKLRVVTESSVVVNEVSSGCSSVY